MKIKEIYSAAITSGLASSQVDFSRIWLGRSARYYSQLIAVGGEPGLATLCGIKWRLEMLLSQGQGKPGNILLELKQRIGDEIERRAITDRRRHRS